MLLNKIQFNNLNLEKVQGCTCGENQAPKIYYTASTIVCVSLSPTVSVNQAEKTPPRNIKRIRTVMVVGEENKRFLFELSDVLSESGHRQGLVSSFSLRFSSYCGMTCQVEDRPSHTCRHNKA